jgi:hypothetical protein
LARLYAPSSSSSSDLAKRLGRPVHPYQCEQNLAAMAAITLPALVAPRGTIALAETLPTPLAAAAAVLLRRRNGAPSGGAVRRPRYWWPPGIVAGLVVWAALVGDLDLCWDAGTDDSAIPSPACTSLKMAVSCRLDARAAVLRQHDE